LSRKRGVVRWQDYALSVAHGFFALLATEKELVSRHMARMSVKKTAWREEEKDVL